MEEENKDVFLFGCGCGDRDCVYFPIEVIRKENLISWHIPDRYRPLTFTFNYSLYKEEFQEFSNMIEKEAEELKAAFEARVKEKYKKCP